ncbi:hypothetical protein JOF48_002762 [Arthrobacter stackebrandtii]|uniref:Uncharacterized protein n=1 Tax=Arthrobacter stackebrandtii TaxID=272161 RepID=A0ABS4YYU7_9MICC|nr:hypothetical protein [Arthrobacter stackebrandtii]
MNEPQNFRALVESASARHETFGRQLAFLTQKEDITRATTTVNAIRQGTYKSVPTDESIQWTAWLAGISDEVAFRAAGQPIPGPPLAEELPPVVGNVPRKRERPRWTC